MKKWNRFWKRIFHRNDTDVINEKQIEDDESYLYDMMSGEILKYIRRTTGLSGKNLHVILVDDDAGRTKFVLRRIYEQLNYLTIVTRFSDSFEEMAEEICYETGLSVGFSTEIPQYADLILEPSENRLQICGETPEWIEFGQLQFYLDGQPIDSFLLQKAIWRETSQDLRQFGDGEFPEEYVGRIDISRSKRV